MRLTLSVKLGISWGTEKVTSQDWEHQEDFLGKAILELKSAEV